MTKWKGSILKGEIVVFKVLVMEMFLYGNQLVGLCVQMENVLEVKYLYVFMKLFRDNFPRPLRHNSISVIPS